MEAKMEKVQKISTFVFFLGLLLLAINLVYPAKVIVFVSIICLILSFIFGVFNYFLEIGAVIIVKSFSRFSNELKQAFDQQEKEKDPHNLL